ncbi:MAG: hypothetical protein H0V25_04300 [Solirubrobacterales bacterium]|nr:hypothetical protein [Solirubrobacterales bacterium]
MPEAGEEQTREERLEIARRYRERRGGELRDLAGRAIDGDVVAAGEFSTVPTEALAAIPLVGMVLVPWSRRRSRRRTGLPPSILLALSSGTVHALELQPADVRRAEAEVREAKSWPRAGVSVESVGRAFMRSVVTLRVPDADQPVVLYAPSLRTNPWSAEVVRALGGDAPKPLDLT